MPFVKEGDTVEAGQRVGLIRFGSRVDVYLPAGTAPQVLLGQRTIAGETVLGEIGVDTTADRHQPVTDDARDPRGIPFRAMIPNAITALALCIGSDRRQLRHSRRVGKGARRRSFSPACSTASTAASPGCLRAQSRFGAELDSLSDNIAFGTAPALILFLWSLQTAPRFGWIAALALAVCCALRLARFNARLDAAEQPHKSAGLQHRRSGAGGGGARVRPDLSVADHRQRRSSAHWQPVMAWTLFIAAADDLEPADLQLVEHSHPPRLAAVRACRHRSCLARR